MKKISYVFKSGRLQRLGRDTQYPTEFYYSLEYFQNKYPNLNIIEDAEALNKIIEKANEKILCIPGSDCYKQKHSEELKRIFWISLSTERPSISTLYLVVIFN